MRTFKIYSLSNFQIYRRVLSPIVIMLYRHARDLFISNWKFVPLTIFTQFSHALAPPLATTKLICFYEVVFVRFRFHM